MLLPLPEDDSLTSVEALVDLWRRLFHARVDRAIEQDTARSNVAQAIPNNQQPRVAATRSLRSGAHASESALRSEDSALRIHGHFVSSLTAYGITGPDVGGNQFDPTFLHEIRTVMEEENRLPAPADDSILFREFAAFLLELNYFFPDQVESYFPGLLHPHEVIRRLDECLEARAIFESTRPAGVAPAAAVHAEDAVAPITPEAIIDDPRLLSKAVHAADNGNDVRAAILYRKLKNVAEAEACLQHLVERLKAPLHLDDEAAEKWFETLRPLLEPATRGFWPVSGRLLYELQKACLDVERKVYAINIFEVIVTFGQQPLNRLLDKPREVRILRRLRSALRFSQQASVTAEQRDQSRTSFASCD